MIKLTLDVFRPDGSRARLFDYLLEAMEFKLRHFCEAVGIISTYEAGELRSPHCEGRAGKLKLGKEEGSNGYGPKNIILDYVVGDERALKHLEEKGNGYQPPMLPASFEDDDLRF